MALTLPRRQLGDGPAALPHRAGGGREPGLRARLRGAGDGVGEGRRGGGRPEGRAAAAHRRRQPPRSRRAGRGEGRGPGGPPRRARHWPHAHRHRRARGRDGLGPGGDRGRGSAPSWTRRWPSARSRRASSTSSPTRTWTSATPTRSRRWSASSGRTSATRWRSSRRRRTCRPRRASAGRPRACGPWRASSTRRRRRSAASFAEAVKRGDLELPANLTNILTGLCHPEELARWTDASRRLKRRYGIETSPVAMHTDIPGLAWPTVTALAQAGVRYFSSGPNYMPNLMPDGGDRIGSTLVEHGDRPFWWVSPSGRERLLMWVAGRGYSWFHGGATRAGRRRRHARDPRLLARAHRSAATRTRSSRCATRSAGTTGPWTRSCPSSWRAGTSATRRRGSSSTPRRASSRPSSAATGRPSPRSGAT